MKTACFAAALALLAVALAPVQQASARKTVLKREDPAATGVHLARLLGEIAQHRDETWRWQKVMQRPRTVYAASAEAVRSIPYRQWVVDLWRDRAAHARVQALNPPHKTQWLCIHHHEGAWKDPSAPYYGGLQMDIEFQQTYGRPLLRAKGTADHWSPLEQMWVAERAYKTRGFWPWPNTARYCGLL